MKKILEIGKLILIVITCYAVYTITNELLNKL